MTDSRLTVRTLCLATVAFILACGHAARAMGQQKPSGDRTAAKAPATRIIRVVPAGSGHTTVATFTATSGGGGRTGASKVATFTRKSGAGSGNSVVTFTGDRVIRQASAAYHPKTRTKPSTPKGGSLFAPKKDTALIAVRRPGTPPAEYPAPPKPAPAPEPVAPAPEPQKQRAPGLRNVFGGLTAARSATVESGSAANQVYAQAARR